MTLKREELSFIKTNGSGNVMYVHAVDANGMMLHCINLASPKLAMKTVARDKVQECECEAAIQALESWTEMSKESPEAAPSGTTERRRKLISERLYDQATMAAVAYA